MCIDRAVYQPGDHCMPEEVCGWFLCMMSEGSNASSGRIVERDKGIRWMPWHQEAMKDVARCEKPWGAASRL